MLQACLLLGHRPATRLARKAVYEIGYKPRKSPPKDGVLSVVQKLSLTVKKFPKKDQGLPKFICLE